MLMICKCIVFAILSDMTVTERRQIYVDGSDHRYSVGQYKAAAFFVAAAEPPQKTDDRAALHGRQGDL